MDAEDLNFRRFRAIFYLTASGSVFWLAAIVAAPYLRSRGLGSAGFFYACFASTCHQIPSRSFALWGFPMAVCARCFGIYTGFAAGVLLYPFRRGFSAPALPSLKMFAFVSMPIVIDTAGNFLKLWDTGSLFRFLTGFIWGMILPLYWFAGLAGLF
jgi:uncharacterized membrane protein